MKYCNSCYAENNDNANRCEICGQKFDNAESHYDGRCMYVICCPVCGRIYNVSDINARIDVCSDCGSNISSEAPVQQIVKELCIYLERLSTKKRYVIFSDKATVLGRDVPGEINEDSFQEPTFSRNECTIEYTNGFWLIYTENNHGHLFINGEQMPAYSRRSLDNGDIITIFTCRFRVVM